MKKRITLLCIAILCVVTCIGCQKKNNAEQVTEETAEVTEETAEVTTETAEATTDSVPIKVAALKGPTAMGMVKMMDDAKNTKSYEFQIASAVDEITPMLVKGEVDIAAVPANLASVLYNNTKGEVKVLAINTLGVLYIVENGDTVHSIADLKGKTIYASGKGATPEYSLNYILKENGIDPQKDVTIEYKSEHSECVAALASEENAIAMLPQPFVTTAQMKNESIRIAIDLNEAWAALQTEDNKSAMVTGAVVVRTEYLKQHQDQVNEFLDAYKDSVDYVNTNVEEAATMIEEQDIVPAAVAKTALPYCNIVFIEGEEMKAKLEGYYSVLFDQNPKSVGGTLPDESFYYKR
ncbi:ABC transporter substrate-binding protein [Anaerosporobacter faecicola]|uniref:ABC transporter substrate-binding protein n=1 Tax=Anaerosporobacter faecicola TaxID=2718714 RepID=UPI0014399D52|nr:ABC transporter substrate-binding protein [Anaerosporobacter faecicola]